MTSAIQAKIVGHLTEKFDVSGDEPIPRGYFRVLNRSDIKTNADGDRLLRSLLDYFVERMGQVEDPEDAWVVLATGEGYGPDYDDLYDLIIEVAGDFSSGQLAYYEDVVAAFGGTRAWEHEEEYAERLGSEPIISMMSILVTCVFERFLWAVVDELRQTGPWAAE